MTRHSKEVLSYFFDIQHGGDIPAAADVFHVQVGQIENGDVIAFYLQLQRDQIVRARFKAYGSPVTIACCEWVCRFLERNNKNDLYTLTSDKICQELNLPSFKLHVTNLIEEALKKIAGMCS